MLLNVIVDEQSIDLNVPDALLQEAEDSSDGWTRTWTRAGK